ncbi:MAG: PilZ domain-containing protein [Candidatus Omnitrophica bacterium]|nr:PilZ domain-containing protein [Candidatus Omnitrophota bacterium]
MAAYAGPERRKNPRINARFIVSYRIIEEQDNIDITQTKNLGRGGMLLTTNRAFNPGTRLALEIRLPFDPNPITLTGRVVTSQEVTRGLIYDTRLEFLSVDSRHEKIISDTVNCYLRKDCK